MRLNPSQVNAVVSYLRQIPDTTCALCHEQEWRVSETVFALPEYALPSSKFSKSFDDWGAPPSQKNFPFDSKDESFKKEPEIFPVIPIVCGRCGFVFFISAVAAGVVKSETLRR